MSTIFRTELKLLLRHWGVWIMTAAGILLTFTLGADQTLNSLPYWIDESVFRFYVMGPLLLGVAAGRRARADRVSELIDASPYNPWLWICGRYLANAALWLAGSIPIWVLAAIRFPGNLPTLALHWAVAAPVTVALLTAVGFFLGNATGSAMAGYSLAVAYYFAGVFVPMMTDSVPPIPWLWLDWLSPQRWLPLTPTGYFPNTALVFCQRLAGAGGAVALGAGLVVWLAFRRRLPVRGSVAVLVLACAVTVGAAARTQALWTDREEAVAAAVEAVPKEGQAAAQPATPVRINRYDLSLAFAPAEHTVSIVGSLEVTNGGTAAITQIDLTLRSNFTVESLATADGERLDFERSGDRLTVQRPLAPGETVRLTGRWKGAVWQWGENRGRRYQTRSLGAHVAPESIFLPATYGWYPIPGDIQLAYRPWEWMVSDKLSVQSPATFSVKTSGTTLNVLTNAGDDRPGMYLLGTPLPTTVVDGVGLIVAPHNRDRALAIYKDLEQRAAVVGETRLPTRIIEVPEGFEYGLQVATELQVTPGAALVRTFDFDPPGPFSNVPVLSARWWDANPTVHGAALGLGAYLEQALLGKESADLRWPDGDSISKALTALELARGRETTLSVVRELYALRPDGPTQEQVVAAISQAAQGNESVLKALEPAREQ